MTSGFVVGVAGAGAWGMALANAAAAAGRDVVLWGRDGERDAALGVDAAAATGCRACAFRSASSATADLGALERCDAILVATPAQAYPRGRRRGSRRSPESAPLVTCAKGIERGTHAFMTEVLAEAAPGRPAAILSGPSFAADVAAGLPTAVTLASADEALARALCRASARTEPRGSIIRPTFAASRSAARPRTCSRSPAASPPAAGSARARSRR